MSGTAVVGQPCLLCGQCQYRVWAIGPRTDTVQPSAYRYIECKHCGLVVMEKPPVASEIMYVGSGYYKRRSTLLRPLVELLMPITESARLNAVEQCFSCSLSRSLLDVGCGKGRFLRYASKRGWQVTGLDPFDRVEFSSPEIRVVCEPLRDDLWGSEKFDVITFWHVLEHLDDPITALCIAHRWLRQGGVVAIEVPNIESWQANIGKGLWFHLDPPRHLYHFSPPTLHRLLEKAGFADVKWIFPSVGLSYFGMLQTALNLLGLPPNLLYNLIKRNRAGLPQRKWELLFFGIAGCIFTGAALLIPTLILTALESSVRRGGVMIVTARKV